jgi:hypothetical protein
MLRPIKLLAEESQIILAELSVMDADQRACSVKKRAIILQRDALSHISFSIILYLFDIETFILCTWIRYYLCEQLNPLK